VVAVGEGGVREELVVRFMACTTLRGREEGVSGCEQGGGTDEATGSRSTRTRAPISEPILFH
jgi:hypothetical protein